MKLNKFKKARVVLQLHSDTTGHRRRRSMYRLQKFAFRFLEANFKHLTKIFRDSAKTNRDFELNSIAFYNNIAFLVYRLGYMCTLSASISAVKRN
jgi:hypothetical protein